MKKLLILLPLLLAVGIAVVKIALFYREVSGWGHERSERLVNDTVRVFIELHEARQALKTDGHTVNDVYSYRRHVEKAVQIVQGWKVERQKKRRVIVNALEGAVGLYRETVPLQLSVHKSPNDDTIALLSAKSEEAGNRLLGVEAALAKPPGILTASARKRIVKYLDSAFEKEFRALADDPQHSASFEVRAAFDLRTHLNHET